VPLIGRHSIHTALRAAAVGLMDSLTWQDIVAGLRQATTQLRLIAVRTEKGALLLDDTYNASPESTLAALNLLDDLDGRKVAVLGDMLELGRYELRGHEMVGIRAAEVSDELITIGERGRMIASSARRAGLEDKMITEFENSDQAISFLEKHLNEGDGSDQRLTWYADGSNRDRIGASEMRDPALVLALTGFSFMLTVIWGEPFLRVLHYLNVGALIRVDGPERHFKKQGTPTMGGWLFVLPVVLITFLLNAVTLIGQTFLGRSIFLPVGTMLGFAFLGAIDDWQKLRGQAKILQISAHDGFGGPSDLHSHSCQS
jgi:hypothetical protein